MRHRHNGYPPVYTYADQVNNSLYNLKLYKAKTKDSSEVKNVRDRQYIQKENEDSNQTIKSLQFCEKKRHKGENVEKWIERVRLVANECEYQEHDRQITEQFICGLNDEHMQSEIISEIEARSKADKITSKHVLMWAIQEESNRT